MPKQWLYLEHAEAVAVFDGLEESVLQLLLARILWQQQHVEAGVRCRKSVNKQLHNKRSIQ